MNKKVLYTLIGIAAAGTIGAVAIAGSSKKHEEIDLSSHTQAVVKAETVPSTTPAPTKAPETMAAPETKAVESVQATLETYKEGKIEISYPVVSGLSDTAKQDELNGKLKNNALAIIKAYDLESSDASMKIKCKVITINRQEICVTYEGDCMLPEGAHPTNIFYTNTIDINSLEDLGFTDFADPVFMAGYVMSNDLKLKNGDTTQLKAFKENRESLGQDYFTKYFKAADFPFTGEFPECFSYAKDGNIYFSLPVPHAAGDYVIAVYSTESK